jgi:hypothetical protein
VQAPGGCVTPSTAGLRFKPSGLGFGVGSPAPPVTSRSALCGRVSTERPTEEGVAGALTASGTPMLTTHSEAASLMAVGRRQTLPGAGSRGHL